MSTRTYAEDILVVSWVDAVMMAQFICNLLIGSTYRRCSSIRSRPENVYDPIVMSMAFRFHAVQELSAIRIESRE